MDRLSIPELAEKVQITKEQVRKADVGLEAAKLDRSRQKKRLSDLLRQLETSEVNSHRISICKEGFQRLEKLEDESCDMETKCAELKSILRPIAEWNTNAQALLTLIDLELQ